MKNIFILIYFTSLAVPVQALTDNVSVALNYFQQGEVSYFEKKYELALTLYKKAIELHQSDGELVVEKLIVIKSASYGRFAKKVTNENLIKKAYFPNQRLAEINNLLREKQRQARPPKLQLEWMTIREPTHDNVLDGGEHGAMIVNVDNSGLSDALDVYLEISSYDAEGLSYQKKVSVGNIATQQSITASVDIAASMEVTDKNHKVAIIAREKSGFDSNVMEVLLRTKPHQPSKIILSNIEIHDLSGDAKIEPTETVTVTANVYNKGAGVSLPLVAYLDLGDNVYLGPDNKKSQQLEKLYPGGSRHIEFTFLTNQRFAHKQKIPAAIEIRDSQDRLSASKDLGISIYAPDNRVSINIAPREREFEYGNDSDLVDIDLNIPMGNMKNPDAVAVVIGNKSYQISGVPRVEYALNDARIMKSYLIKTLGFSENNIIYLEDATSARFTETFGSSKNFAGKLYNYVKPGISDVFIYYSGHGAPDLNNKNAYFVPVDVDPAYISTSGYSLDRFYKNLAKIPAKRFTIVLDTCFSGNSDGGFLLSNISPAIIHTTYTNPLLDNASIFTSTEKDQVSGWFHGKKHGLFTYYFLKGLSGDADSNDDAIITTTEMGQYVLDRVTYQARRLSGHIQTPVLNQKSIGVLARFNK